MGEILEGDLRQMDARIMVRAAVSLGAVVLAFSLASCSAVDSDGKQVSESEAAATVDYGSVLREPGLVSRAKTYESVAALREDADLVVVAVGTRDVREDPIYSDEYGPLAIVDVIVERGLFGSSPSKGDRLPILVEGRRLDDGTVTSDRIEPSQRYVLFLVDDPGSDGYGVVGYLAGQYEEVAPGKFGRVDPESPELPIGLDVAGDGTVSEVAKQ